MNNDAASVFDRNAQLYTEKYMDVSQYKDMLDSFCEHLPGNDILDVACGPGNIARYLLNKQPALHITGIDLAPNMISLARQHVPEATFRVMDCTTISELPQQYDGIICSFLLPYLSPKEVQDLVNMMAQQLKPKGILYISFMEGDNTNSAYQTSSKGDTLFINIHAAYYLQQCLQQADMDIISSTHMAAPGNATYKTNDMVLLAKKK